jgi:hypothetical protein
MGVAFQCMVRLTVYAMSYKLYVVESMVHVRPACELVREGVAEGEGDGRASRFALLTQMRFSSRNGL